MFKGFYGFSVKINFLINMTKFLNKHLNLVKNLLGEIKINNF